MRNTTKLMKVFVVKAVTHRLYVPVEKTHLMYALYCFQNLKTKSQGSG